MQIFQGHVAASIAEYCVLRCAELQTFCASCRAAKHVQKEGAHAEKKLICCAEPGASAEGAAAGGLQVALLGTGEGWMERALAALSSSFPSRAAGVPKFDELIAHLLMAAADYVIVPSRFEPCGLVAQSAARYGAIPIVTAVGGLRDFVTPEVPLLALLE